MGVQETHLKGCGVYVSGQGDESELWQGVEGCVVWCGMEAESRGRGREECALVISLRVWKGVE